MKRLFDIVASGFGLIVLSPLFLMLAIWIKMDSKGPVFYRQVRVGYKNQDFRIFKFRSMRVGADKGSLVTIGGRDPRVTKSGYWIRKFKLDELPQLINVFIGDMSLVGPRPEVRHYVDYWTEEQMHVLRFRAEPVQFFRRVLQVVFIDPANGKARPGPVPAVPDAFQVLDDVPPGKPLGSRHQYVHTSFLHTILFTTPT